MSSVKVISFDVEGTLVTTDFSYGIWFEAMPESYAQRYGMTVEEAKAVVESEYSKIGDQNLDWCDINYWVKKFDIGTKEMLMDKCMHRVSYYPEVMKLLDSLNGNYVLSVASGSPREFLHYLLRDIQSYFHHIFSSTSDYRRLKDSSFYQSICREMGVHPADVMHIGDNWQFDYCEAKNAGIRAFYLDRSGQKKDAAVLSSLAQISNYLS